jgi:hypothetical protein
MERVRAWAGLGAFFCGLGVIVSAVIFNVWYDRLSETSALPPVIANLYASSGKGGVTATFAVVGLSIMFLGMAIPRTPRDKPAPRLRLGTVVPMFTPPDPNESEPSVAPSGRVILRTQRYVPDQPAVPGLAPSKPRA